MRTKYELLNKVAVSVAAESNGVKLQGERIGVVASISAELWMGDNYSGGHHVNYTIVDDTYSNKNPQVVREENILRKVSDQ